MRGPTGQVRGIPMLPAYLPELPDGTETGTYLALDLGGTQLRFISHLSF